MNTKTLINRRTHRTTLTLEADVVEYVEQRLANDRRLKEKSLINDLLRKGIKVDASRSEKPFVVKPFKTRLAKGMTIEKLEEMMREI